ncbi:2Fe-2S iron-sulfur cluster binding domain-containing protein [Arsenicitalea aurantiaca]|uniref:2Fe-2S iron-sulfur cluster binding domain-containing protein n=1 Tax=Arsenicitalea aurantiaca TaxID=1783274 RepID=A0A433XGD4_9HYPH|nr:2Fe-2S iron-sulfur cluster-binding protein [Arsenicitalea aurantiaca]RUT33145.1 2Fe-2S iron-sulfur cluster binding domain-containing protein [Arsenicitalea aurantiaca]
MKILVTDQMGAEHELEGLEGWRVMEVIRDWGLNIKAECGGACSCATCHVFVAEEWLDRLSPRTDEEEDMLDTVPDVRETSRLSCQILMSEAIDGLAVTLAPSAARDDTAA